MAEPSSLPQVIRFGVFELDLRSGQLKKRGMQIKLPDQPFRVLVLLLEHPGEVVTREELCAVLWPQETFVEFEHSLNAAVAKLRLALGDSADNPRFVETVARRGYRFIGSTQVPAAASADPVAAAPLGLAQPLASEPVRKPRAVSYRRSFSLVAAGAVVLCFAIAFVLQRGRAPLPSNVVLNRITSDAGLATEPALSRDGKLLAYASDRSGKGHLDVWVQQMDGGTPLQLTHGDADSHQPDFSPDGTQIVFRSEAEGGAIYKIPTLGGDARLLMAGGQSPRFSPDGEWVAGWLGISADVGDVFVVRSGGGKAQVLEKPGLPGAGNPIWSPDGKHLLVYGSRGLRGDDWWVIPRDGGRATATGAFAALRKQGFSISYPAEVPRVGGWSGDALLFSAKLGDSVNAWRIGISPRSWQVIGMAQRVTSGSNLEVYPSFAPAGGVVYASLSKATTNIWLLPFNLNQAVQTGQPQQLTTGMSPDNSPSLAADGKRLAFISGRTGQEEVWLKDLETGKEAALTTTGSVTGRLVISYDSSRVAYTTGMPVSVAYVVSIAGGQPEKVCGDCGWLMEWSHDGKRLLYTKPTQNGWSTHALDLGTKRDTVFLERKGYNVFQTRFSPDDRWITFGQTEGMSARVFVAPLREGRGPQEAEWILLPTTAKPNMLVWADKPRWSPDGHRVYYVSNQDGYRCIWSQRLDPGTKHPIGMPAAVVHFHNARLSMANISWGELEMDAAKDKLVFNLGELTGNIWSAKPQ